jgi:branched-chain amino acid aminotransferase
MLRREDLKGILAPLPSVFTKSGELDEDANRANVRDLISEGMPIIQATGGSAEYYSLTISEHEVMMRAVAEEAAGKTLTICGCGTVMGTEDAIERVAIAKECGVDGAMLMTPPYFATTPGEVIKFFEDIALAVPGIGLTHYNTARSKVVLGGEHYAELAKVPSFLGVKYGTLNLYEWFSSYSLSPELAHFVTDELWVPAMMAGAKAVDSMIAVTRPAVAIRLWQLCERQQWEEAMALQCKVWRITRLTNALPEAEAQYGDCSIDKGVMKAAGVLRVSDPRPPYAPVGEKILETWRKRFQEFDEGKFDSVCKPAPESSSVNDGERTQVHKDTWMHQHARHNAGNGSIRNTSRLRSASIGDTALPAGRTIYINGKYVPEAEAGVSVFDSACMFGDFVFEMTRSFNRKQFKLRSHLERLYRSIKTLQIPFHLTLDQLEQKVYDVIDHNQPFMDDDDEDRVMINVSRGILTLYHPIFDGDPGPTLVISSFPLSLTMVAFAKIYSEGIHAITPGQRAIPADLLDPKLKSRSRQHYLTANLQVALVDDPNAWALLLDPDGFVTEGTGANFFIVTNGELWTPEPRNILRGVTRAHTMQLAKTLGITVVEKNIELYDVIHAEEAFFTSTPACIYPCTRGNGSGIGSGKMGPVTRRLLEAWSDDVGVDIIAQTQRFANRMKDKSTVGANPYRFQSAKIPVPVT